MTLNGQKGKILLSTYFKVHYLFVVLGEFCWSQPQTRVSFLTIPIVSRPFI